MRLKGASLLLGVTAKERNKARELSGAVKSCGGSAAAVEGWAPAITHNNPLIKPAITQTFH